MGPGVDPHLYKASEGDVGRLQEADIIFYCGLHLEAGMADVLERMAEGEIAVTVAVCEQLDENLLISSEDFGGSHDPHIWFDVNLWKIAARTILGSLNDLDPENVEAYQANANPYLAMLDELETYVRTETERVPPEQRVLITAHDAFGYFGTAYGFEVMGLQGISTESEASTNDVQELADFIAEQQIPAVFIESSVPRRNIEAVQAAVQARGFDVQIGGATPTPPSPRRAPTPATWTPCGSRCSPTWAATSPTPARAAGPPARPPTPSPPSPPT